MIRGPSRDYSGVRRAARTPRPARGRDCPVGPARRRKTRWCAEFSPGWGLGTKCPAELAIVQPYPTLNRRPGHVDLVPGGGSVRAGGARPGCSDGAVMLIEWPERAGEAGLARGPPPVARFAKGGARRLDSEGARGPGRSDGQSDDSAGSRSALPRRLRLVGAARIETVAGDASFRRYFRVIGDGRSGGDDGCPAAARGPEAIRRVA